MAFLRKCQTVCFTPICFAPFCYLLVGSSRLVSLIQDLLVDHCEVYLIVVLWRGLFRVWFVSEELLVVSVVFLVDLGISHRLAPW